MVAVANRSFFSKSNGNEPATLAFQKGVLTRKLTGKAYYQQWSQNVKFEGKGVCRHLDIMTHNHGSNPGNTAPFPFLSEQALANGTCKAEKDKIKDNCKAPNDYEGEEESWHWTKSYCGNVDTIIDTVKKARAHILRTISQSQGNSKTFLQNELTSINRMSQKSKKRKTATMKLSGDISAKAAGDNDCVRARRCQLVPYTNKGEKRAETSKKDDDGCCNGQTGHHLIPDAMIRDANCGAYNVNDAPVVCTEGTNQYFGSHGRVHSAMDNELIRLRRRGDITNNDKLHIKQAINCAAKSHRQAFPSSGYSDACIKAQLRYYYNQCHNSELDAKTKAGKSPKDTKSSPRKLRGFIS